MIEVVYKEEKKKPVGNEEFFHVPKNIRQIGEVDDDFKIYIEDYAYHYLDRIADEVSGGRIALLLGQSNWSKGISYVFIKSAFELKGMEADTNRVSFDEEIWNKAHEMMEEYFPNQEVVGWFFTMPECQMELTDAMYRAHMNYFAGNNRIFFMKEPLDKDEVFFRYDDGKMRRQRGYYLYYERNDAMQSFLIEKNNNKPMEQNGVVQDKAVKDFRKTIASKKKPDKEPKKEKAGSYFMYTSAAAAVILALALGSNYLNDYQELRNTPGIAQRVVSQVRQNTVRTTSTPTELPEETATAAEIPEKMSTPSNSIPETPVETPQEVETPTETSPKTETPSLEQEKVKESVAKETPSSRADAEEASGTAVAYTVREGDTLISISREIYGNTDMVDSICQMNGISEDATIYVGERILLP